MPLVVCGTPCLLRPPAPERRALGVCYLPHAIDALSTVRAQVPTRRGAFYLLLAVSRSADLMYGFSVFRTPMSTLENVYAFVYQACLWLLFSVFAQNLSVYLLDYSTYYFRPGGLTLIKWGPSRGRIVERNGGPTRRGVRTHMSPDALHSPSRHSLILSYTCTPRPQ